MGGILIGLNLECLCTARAEGTVTPLSNIVKESCFKMEKSYWMGITEKENWKEQKRKIGKSRKGKPQLKKEGSSIHKREIPKMEGRSQSG